MGAFTGDFLFVGDVGRPDLLEKAAGVEGAMRAGASELFASLQRFRQLDDWIQIWPGHGAGSACGKGLGAVPQTTLGYEKRFNWAFGHDTEDSFRHKPCSRASPTPRSTSPQMKRINRDGPPILGGLPEPARIADDRLSEALEQGVVIDLRPSGAFAGGHVPGTISIPLNRSFTTMAGWLVPYDRPIRFIAEGGDAATQAARQLSTIGLDRVEGYFETSALARWASAGGDLETIGRMTPDELEDQLESQQVHVVDVRWQNEWDQGRIPGAHHISLGEIRERVNDVPTDRPVVLHCAGGARSAIAAGLLQSLGITDVINLEGGFDRWVKEGHPVEESADRPATDPAPAI
jgi:hydroxyacylglutathione hydrolase